MKKKMLLIILMFMFMTNVNALSFDVGITNIEDAGNNGTIGSITKIDQEKKEIDAFFQDIGDEVSFSITVTNTGDRAGTLRSIDFGNTNDKIEYTSNLPDGGLAINGNDTNEVTITAKVKQGAVNGKTTSDIKIKYTYDEGSCPDGEILSEDESMCLCPEGMERNEKGICVKPEKEITCEEDEIYNAEKKICEKKVVPTPDNKPINPSNPKTLDNIILITLLFFVSGLGIYAVMFKRLNTNKKKVTAGVITGVITFSISFTVLASVFGLDNLLSAIVNPITKSRELVVKVNEEIELIETWDGECSLDNNNLTPDKIFQGGTGTESDPYQVKTAEQLSCFAKSVNNGETYQGKYIKQTKNIKLNDKVLENVENNTLTGLNAWIPIGYSVYDSNSQTTLMKDFRGAYNGDTHVISGLYLNDSSYSDYKALFGCAVDASVKNLVLSDVYMNASTSTSPLIGSAYGSLTVDNIKTYGKVSDNVPMVAGVVSIFQDNGPTTPGILKIENAENNINLTNSTGTKGGIIAVVNSINTSAEPNVILKDVTNNGDILITDNTTVGGIIGVISSPYPNTLIENAVNTGDFNNSNGASATVGGIAGYLQPLKLVIKDSYNTGNFEVHPFQGNGGYLGGIVGQIGGYPELVVTIDNCFNSGNMTYNSTVNGQMIGLEINLEGMSQSEFSPFDNYDNGYIGGIVGGNGAKTTITNSYNTGNLTVVGYDIGGIVGGDWGETFTMESCYNTGNIVGTNYVGGLIGAGGKVLTKSYNTGTVVQFANGSNNEVGGLIGTRSRNAAVVTLSYNEGDIILKSKIVSGNAAGICGHCDSVTNSYNRGNITSKYAGSNINGINASYINSGVTNVYNSGKITVQGIDMGYTSTTSIYASGIVNYNGNVTNAYNVGDILVERNESYFTSSYVGGIGAVAGGTKTNCVNTGNITYKVNKPFTVKQSINLSGIANFQSSVTNSFNSGTITLDDTALDHPLVEDVFGEYKNSIFIGEITSNYSENISNNKYNTNSSNNTLGCLYALNNDLINQEDNLSCTLANSNLAGQYTTEATPDILSIINGDDAFEIKEGETLPTLKVFNQ